MDFLGKTLIQYLQFDDQISGELDETRILNCSILFNMVIHNNL